MAKSWYSELAGDDRNAADALIGLFEEYGLGSLAPNIMNMLRQGFGSDTIYLRLQETPEWRRRFRANDARVKNGLPALSPQEYLATERAYRQALQATGMPKGWYDSLDDFTDFLVKDISPSEILERATEARKRADTIDPVQRRALNRMGIDTSHIAAYWLDSERAMPLLQKEWDTALLNAERQRAGYGYDDKQAERLFQMGITTEQAREGYNVIQTQLPNLERLGDISGVNYGLDDLESEVFGGNADSTRTRTKLASQERGRFSGSAGSGQSTLSQDRTFN